MIAKARGRSRIYGEVVYVNNIVMEQEPRGYSCILTNRVLVLIIGRLSGEPDAMI